MKNKIRNLIAYTYRVRSQLNLTADKSKAILKLRNIIKQYIVAKPFVAEAEKNTSSKINKINVLIYGPISTCGLTTQVRQLVEILDKNKLTYEITYYSKPTLKNSSLLKNYRDIKDVSKPELIFFFERFHTNIPYFSEAKKMYYVNLDWLDNCSFKNARLYADIVMLPTEYKFSEFSSLFVNSNTHMIPWPSIFPMHEARIDALQSVRILYIGNNYDKKSRKHPVEVVDAILNCTNPALKFTLKFIKKPPSKIMKKLIESKNVESVKYGHLTSLEMQDLYSNSDINLIPNSSEGNGLSILESVSNGVVPVVLDGFPMKKIVNKDFCYFIKCEDDGFIRFMPKYKTTALDISNFFSSINTIELNKKKNQLKKFQKILTAREEEIERFFVSSFQFLKIGERYIKGGDSLLGKGKVDIRKKTVDVYMTTHLRADKLQESLESLMVACRNSPFEHRINILVDKLDQPILKIISKYLDDISIVSTNNKLGLPFMINLVHDHVKLISERTERKSDFVCYIQDDCVIQNTKGYFIELIGALESIGAKEPVGYVSGFHCKIHPGFEKGLYNGNTIIKSDTIDGKNFLAKTSTFLSIGKLSWYFDDCDKRGNPGPVRGSHFDLWQWKESPNSLMKQGLYNIIFPGFCTHSAKTKYESCWNNDTSDANVEKRIELSNIYKTRSTVPILEESEYYSHD